MLKDENDIKDQTDVGESKLDRVPRESGPVGLESAIYYQLEKAEDPAAEVE